MILLSNRFYFFIIHFVLAAETLFSIKANAEISIVSTTLKEAVFEYVGKTEEVRILKGLLTDEQSLFIMGSGATTIALYVKKHLDDPKTNPLPDQLLSLFSRDQDLDLVIDSNYEELKEYKDKLSNDPLAFSLYKLIDLVTLNDENGRGIINNRDWQIQNSDLVSTGLVKLVDSSKKTSLLPGVYNTRAIKLRARNEIGFLNVILTGQNHYLDGKNHYEAFLGKVGRNPKVVSAVKTISNNIRFNLSMSESDITLISSIIRDFTQELVEGRLVLGTSKWVLKNEDYVFSRIHTTALKALNWEPDNLDKNLNFFDEIGMTELIKHLEVLRPELKGFESIKKRVTQVMTCKSIL